MRWIVSALLYVGLAAIIISVLFGVVVTLCMMPWVLDRDRNRKDMP